jgi:flavodoxin
MKSVVIYDSIYGNTEKIAEVISKVLHATLLHVSEGDPQALSASDLVIFGSPVHGGLATPAVREFIKKVPDNSLENVKVTAFDTRFSSNDHGVGIWLLLNVIRYAADRIAKDLSKTGGQVIAKPEGFLVKDKTGPLKQGELERAYDWAQRIKVLFS